MRGSCPSVTAIADCCLGGDSLNAAQQGGAATEEVNVSAGGRYYRTMAVGPCTGLRNGRGRVDNLLSMQDELPDHLEEHASALRAERLEKEVDISEALETFGEAIEIGATPHKCNVG